MTGRSVTSTQATPARGPVDSQSTGLYAVGISKQFGGVTALKGVDLHVRPGEVHAVLGENGAGKSTLIKILSGMYEPSAGTITIDGVQHTRLTPALVRDLGISTVFQEMSLVPTLTVTDNIHLGRELRRGLALAKRAMREEAAEALARLDVKIPLSTRVESLSRAERQLVEIASAVHQDARYLILDEPTASLNSSEAEKLFEVVESLRRSGVGIVYISHRLTEIDRLADRVTVLRDGALIGTVLGADTDSERLVEMMTGREADALYPVMPRNPGAVRLRLNRLSTRQISDVTLEVRAGEIVGVAGLVGSGKSSIGKACFGVERVDHGEILLDGQNLRNLSPQKAMSSGLIYYPSDRKDEGLVSTATLEENLTLSGVRSVYGRRGGVLRRGARRAAAKSLVETLQIRPPNLKANIGAFSGGNQQKALLARGFIQDFGVHVFDEPTVGIDVGARAEVYRLIKHLILQGAAVLLISSDMEEILGLSHRVYVMNSGRIQGELAEPDMSESNVLNLFF
jgi:ribose transport system ATP-binding protein